MDKPKQVTTTKKPYLVLAPGSKSKSFSCAQCAMLVTKGDEFHCSSSGYQAWAGTSLLKGLGGGKLTDPTKACSDWFEERK